jgi:hypothetical protein
MLTRRFVLTSGAAGLAAVAGSPWWAARSHAAGEGVVTGQRLYQLVRQNGPIGDRTFDIRFLDPGVHAYAFMFG